MTTAAPGQSPATQIDLAQQQLYRQANQAINTAKAAFPRAVAKTLSDELAFLASHSWRGEQANLRALIDGINAMAVQLQGKAA